MSRCGGGDLAIAEAGPAQGNPGYLPLLLTRIGKALRHGR